MPFAVFKVIERDEAAGLDEVAEEVLVGGVGGDAGGHHDAGASRRADEPGCQLGEDGVGIDVAPTGQGIAAAGAQELARGVCIVQGLLVLLPEGGVGFLQPGDEPFAGSGVGRAGDLGVTRGKEFFLLELDAFPRGIGEHHVEAGTVSGEWRMARFGEWRMACEWQRMRCIDFTIRHFAIRYSLSFSAIRYFAIRYSLKNFGKLDRPVEEAVRAGKRLVRRSAGACRRCSWVYRCTPAVDRGWSVWPGPVA
ncbi:MAG: hypothetical protein KatS3mg109_2214 [Pirellulaceae bacterium]|nr:MAG: hypothetical protein KatS3mg109_2214 [Pirellulaceae bacterium]